jgi:hypothetical protein
MPRERILITVKTYPTLSRKYGELVCTAGVREDGSWIRLYPIPFRLLDYQERYSKFEWLETTLVKSTKDPRPESFHPVDPKDLVKIRFLDTSDNWRERRRLILGKSRVHTHLAPLIDAAHTNQCSLAVFKPSSVTDFIWESGPREWDAEKVEEIRARGDQGELFADEDWRRTLKLIPRLPWKFSYRFADAAGQKSEMQVLDWETGQLFWNCLKQAQGNETVALTKVREKYLGEFAKKDLHFFLGTTQQYHGWATNPWVIIGVFPIPHERQIQLI